MARTISVPGRRLLTAISKTSCDGLEMLPYVQRRPGQPPCYVPMLASATPHWQQLKHQTASYAVDSASRRKPFARIPPNSWDSHMHVIDQANYPLAPSAQYKPQPHPLSDALDFSSTIGIPNLVLVQPSIYGTDNSCLLSALRTLGPSRARGVVALNPALTTERTMQDLHALGVRGVRVKMGGANLATALQQYAQLIRPFDWVLQLYVPLRMAKKLQTIVPDLGVRVCLDHFGQPDLGQVDAANGRDPYALAGFGALVDLLRQGRTYVKMSAAYRFSRQKNEQDIEPLARELLKVAGKRHVVFATDWPHTRFEGLDIKPFIERVLEWCGDDQELVERVFKGNAVDLWDVKE